jgi:hypothetical protein
MARGIIEFMTIMVLTIVGILMVIIAVSAGVDEAGNASKRFEPPPSNPSPYTQVSRPPIHWPSESHKCSPAPVSSQSRYF